MIGRPGGGYKTYEARVKAEDGAVILTGTARAEAEKLLAAKLVTDIHGVTSVRRKVTIEDAKTK